MNSGIAKPSGSSKPGSGAFPGITPSNQSILLDKLNARRSTPDSEALASSDDEPDSHRQDSLPPLLQQHKPVRRASWLNDTSQPPTRPRQGSLASGSMSPTASHPSTPSAEPGVGGTWNSHSTTSVLGRGHTGSASFPWGPGIWNTERKDPPQRLSEVLPSPTSTIPPGPSSNSFFGGESSLNQTSPGSREQAPSSQIPFAIPLHPTPKTYRSQSYSVGQLEPDAATVPLGPAAAVGTRGRPIPHSGLQHRPSRPSMLSEMSSDGSLLGKVNEDDDDGSTDSTPGYGQFQSSDARAIELLTRESAVLRHQQQQYQNMRLRPRASTAAAYAFSNGYPHESVPEMSDYAIDELDEVNEGPDSAPRRGLLRRRSEFGVTPYRTLYENRKLENVKKALWQSSLGFGGLVDSPQSRRHSFADVPARQGSITSISESVGTHEHTSQEPHHGQEFSAYPETSNLGLNNAVSTYFTQGPTPAAGMPQATGLPTYGSQYPSPYSMIHPSFPNRSSSPHRNMYGLSQPRQNQLLHVVLFKCSRADVFYIQEGTGLTVKPGDLVIVEADRGTDLGTVARDNVDWQTAKELKEHYAEEHYKWLMMYSQNAAAAQDGVGAGLMAASNGMQGSTVGGMGPPNSHHMQEPSSGELKPKLIKRLAQAHEVSALREKEGNEAKAKRVCMQKVKEHNLNMEILDAEFQMDWKKLTFYYFADSYINFNALVTDLFKVYKTRIWMSAINPASFASPTLGLQAPSGIGPGAVVGRGLGAAERRQNSGNTAEQQTSNFPITSQNGRVVRPSNSHSSFTDSGVLAAPGYAPSNYGYNVYGGFGTSGRQAPVSYPPNMIQTLDQFQSGFPQASEYQAGRGRFPPPQPADAQLGQGAPPLVQQTDWVGAFQGLSLNSR
ncbi:hypothetical protein VTK73DRAFT_7822 [Phialemonium thermophilum]|uniref:PSP1 C-terminal domain-containing protein n=1 Tax=Phialemonium thermophilum TaxID=223376 RepID=A0ABR3XSI7_9PEZI